MAQTKASVTKIPSVFFMIIYIMILIGVICGIVLLFNFLDKPEREIKESDCLKNVSIVVCESEGLAYLGHNSFGIFCRESNRSFERERFRWIEGDLEGCGLE